VYILCLNHFIKVFISSIFRGQCSLSISTRLGQNYICIYETQMKEHTATHTQFHIHSSTHRHLQNGAHLNTHTLTCTHAPLQALDFTLEQTETGREPFLQWLRLTWSVCAYVVPFNSVFNSPSVFGVGIESHIVMQDQKSSWILVAARFPISFFCPWSLSEMTYLEWNWGWGWLFQLRPGDPWTWPGGEPCGEKALCIEQVSWRGKFTLYQSQGTAKCWLQPQGSREGDANIDQPCWRKDGGPEGG
jgi:hypothetical protein